MSINKSIYRFISILIDEPQQIKLKSRRVPLPYTMSHLISSVIKNFETSLMPLLKEDVDVLEIKSIIFDENTEEGKQLINFFKFLYEFIKINIRKNNLKEIIQLLPYVRIKRTKMHFNYVSI